MKKVSVILMLLICAVLIQAQQKPRLDIVGSMKGKYMVLGVECDCYQTDGYVYWGYISIRNDTINKVIVRVASTKRVYTEYYIKPACVSNDVLKLPNGKYFIEIYRDEKLIVKSITFEVIKNENN